MSNPPVRSDRDIEEARLLQRKLCAVLRVAEPGAPDPESFQEVLRLCDRALLAVDDEYCQQQLCEVERHAAKMFSASGVMFQRRLILDTLEAIGDRLASLYALGRSADAVGRTDTILEKR